MIYLNKTTKIPYKISKNYHNNYYLESIKPIPQTGNIHKIFDYVCGFRSKDELKIKLSNDGNYTVLDEYRFTFLEELVN